MLKKSYVFPILLIAFLAVIASCHAPARHVHKAWTHPAGLSDHISPDSPDFWSADNPQIAMADNRDAIIVWEQTVGVNKQIFKSEYRNGTWMHPSGLADNITQDDQYADQPQVAMDGQGNAIIVWQQTDGLAYPIYMSEYRGGIWDAPEKISRDGSFAYNPQVAMDDAGNAIIVWQQSDGANAQIFKSEYRNGTWTHPSGLADNISPNGQSAEYPRVAMDDAGNAVIVWDQSDGANVQIFMSEYRNSAWAHPDNLADNISPDDEDAGAPYIAMDNAGSAVIVWDQSDGANLQVFMSEYRNNAWAHPDPDDLTDKISPNGSDARDPQVAMDGAGNTVIVWFQSIGAAFQIFMSEYRNGSWTHPQLTNNISLNFSPAILPRVAMDEAGNAIIVWQQWDDAGNFGIFKSEFRNGVWKHPAGLADHIGPDSVLGVGDDKKPQVAMDNRGNAIIVRKLPDENGSYQIFKSEYR